MIFALLVIIDLFLIMSFAFVPYVTRKTELFGVTFQAEKTNEPQLVRLRASYRNQMLLGGVALVVSSVALGLLLGWESVLSVVLWIVVMSLYLLAAFVLYLPKHRRMKQLKHENGWDAEQAPAVIVADTSLVTKDVVSPAWMLLFPLIIALTIAGIVFIWPQVPEQVPLHFDVTGNVDSWATKGIDAVLPLLVVQAFLAITVALCYVMVRVSKRQIDAANPNSTRRQGIRFRRATSAFLIVIGVACQLMIAIMQIVMLLGSTDVWAILVPGFVLLAVVGVATYILMFRVGQGGSRLREPAGQGARAANVDDDRYWKLGLIYVNPNDPALFVETRFGVGYTANLGRPLSWMILAGLVVVVVALVVFAFTVTG
ncbi:MAG: DUF5808 domain-containing protein [Coriobacteriales bacterium]|jgi:uncharacterized membrane protein|nr:DUF5808 domain-containing protein [Coriobacteriales bacterium]